MNKYTIIPKTMLVAILAFAATDATMAQQRHLGLSSAYVEQTAKALMKDMDNTDADKDSMVSKAEFTDHLERSGTLMFEKLDTDGNGMLSHEELMASMPAEDTGQ